MSNLPFLTFGPSEGTPAQRFERNGVGHLEIEERFAERLKARDRKVREETAAKYRANKEPNK